MLLRQTRIQTPEACRNTAHAAGHEAFYTMRAETTGTLSPVELGGGWSGALLQYVQYVSPPEGMTKKRRKC